MRRALQRRWGPGAIGLARNGASSWFAQRTDRERVILVVGIVFALAAVMITGVVRPLAAARGRALEEISRYESIAEQLRNSSPAAFVRQTTPRRPAATVVTESAASFGLTIRRLEPDGSRTRVALDAATFSNLINWLDRLERDHALRIVAVELDRRPAPGVVAARLTLEE